MFRRRNAVSVPWKKFYPVGMKTTGRVLRAAQTGRFPVSISRFNAPPRIKCKGKKQQRAGFPNCTNNNYSFCIPVHLIFHWHIFQNNHSTSMWLVFPSECLLLVSRQPSILAPRLGTTGLQPKTPSGSDCTSRTVLRNLERSGIVEFQIKLFSGSFQNQWTILWPWHLLFLTF